MSKRFGRETALDSYLRLAGAFHLPPERRIEALSKDIRAKVSLVLALAHDPELLVLDEPMPEDRLEAEAPQ